MLDTEVIKKLMKDKNAANEEPLYNEFSSSN